MQDFFPTIKAPLMAALGAAALVLGSWHALIMTLFILNLLDLVSGIVRAAMTGSLSSTSCGRGALRKLMMWIVVAVAAQMDRLLGDGSYARDATLTVWCVTECVSVLENAAAAGLPVPAFLTQALEKVREASALRLGDGTTPAAADKPEGMA